MVDANGACVGRFSWLRRGWPDLFDQLAAALPRITETHITGERDHDRPSGHPPQSDGQTQETFALQVR